LCVILLN